MSAGTTFTTKLTSSMADHSVPLSTRARIIVSTSSEMGPAYSVALGLTSPPFSLGSLPSVV